MITTYKFDLFADYFQFYLKDEGADGDLSENWTPEAVDRLLALGHGIIGIGTVRNMIVPVTVEIHDTEPDETLDEWDLTNECSIEISSGKLVVAGCTDYLPDAARIELSPGHYRVRIFYDGLKTLSADGLDGEDHYKVVLWRQPIGDPHWQ